MKPVEIQINYDFICPWCWIGHEHLKTALSQTQLNISPNIKYLPYELNPSMPKEGMNRKDYRSAKFGSLSRSQAMDSEVTLVGKRAGLIFNYENVQMTPNTRLAHQLMFFAQQQPDALKSESLFEAIFKAYFTEGQDIGRLDVLVELARNSGFDAEAVHNFLQNNLGEREVIAEELEAQTKGIHSVPMMQVDRISISGAQPVSVITELLQRIMPTDDTSKL